MRQAKVGQTSAEVPAKEIATMLTILKTAIPATIMIAGCFLANISPTYASVKYAKTEGKSCTYCHVTASKSELNAAGQYYAAHDHSLKGYVPAKD